MNQRRRGGRGRHVARQKTLYKSLLLQLTSGVEPGHESKETRGAGPQRGGWKGISKNAPLCRHQGRERRPHRRTPLSLLVLERGDLQLQQLHFPVSARLFHFEEGAVKLQPGEVLIFRASKCHWGAALGVGEPASIAVHAYGGAAIDPEHANDELLPCPRGRSSL